MSKKKYEVCVVGGAGHVGVPLSIALASRGVSTLINDINDKSLDILRAGELPFMEDNAQPLLKEALEKEMLGFSSAPESISEAAIIILTIGTPIDEFHNPLVDALNRCVDSLLPYISDDQTIILRSTVAPGVTRYLSRHLESKGKKCALAFCPERVVQGKGIDEIQSLPQLVSGTSEKAVQVASDLFSKIAPEIVLMKPGEAEFAKLICNAYRYIEFAATNQLYMVVENAGYDYNELLRKMKIGYPRLQSIPGPGFAAGPCLMKDTMQLGSFDKHNFSMGQIAVSINEGLPNYIVERIRKERGTLVGLKIGVLGMAFKSESDDIRDSLSFKLKKLLLFSGADVSCSDEWVKDDSFVSKETLLENSEIVIIGIPHKAYRGLKIDDRCEVIDLWDII